MVKTKNLGSFYAVDGHIVTFSFAAEPNTALCDRLKQMLIASYEENDRIAETAKTEYDNGGETDVP